MVGKSNDPAVLNRGSMIEASFIDGFSSFDVSYIEGYSVPMYVFNHPYPLKDPSKDDTG